MRLSMSHTRLQSLSSFTRESHNSLDPESGLMWTMLAGLVGTTSSPRSVLRRAELRPTLNWHLFDWVQVKCNHGLLAYVLRAKSLAAARERYSLQRNPLRDFLYITNR